MRADIVQQLIIKSIYPSHPISPSIFIFYFTRLGWLNSTSQHFCKESERYCIARVCMSSSPAL